MAGCKESFKRLSGKYELIVMEGAGSPAEINLMDVDIVNMAAAKYAKAPVILVGDIDKGGVFASLYGTVKLLGKDSRYIKAFIINKFRGDFGILKPGLEMIKAKTGKAGNRGFTLYKRYRPAGGGRAFFWARANRLKGFKGLRK